MHRNERVGERERLCEVEKKERRNSEFVVDTLKTKWDHEIATWFFPPYHANCWPVRTVISHCGKCCRSFVFFVFSQCCVSEFTLWNACQVFWSSASLVNRFFLWSLLSSWLQRPIRGRHSNLHSNWRKSPKWRKHWARDHPPSPRARSSQASRRLSAQMAQRWLQ